ncbi:MAG: hypothetical protein D6719_00650 [Candidatus Dadabacteria bacterium]|nr:MAG: hypothetical protein D6719_00650 [Candidatus Dadabacteria bacterium]
MTLLSSDPLTYTVIAVLAGMLLGAVIVRLVMQKDIKDAYKKARAEAEAEKAELKQELDVQFGKIREGLLQTIDAYENAMESVERKLTPASAARTGLAAPKARLQIEHARTSADTDKTGPLTASEPEEAPLYRSYRDLSKVPGTEEQAHSGSLEAETEEASSEPAGTAEDKTGTSDRDEATSPLYKSTNGNGYRAEKPEDDETKEKVTTLTQEAGQ